MQRLSSKIFSIIFTLKINLAFPMHTFALEILTPRLDIPEIYNSIQDFRQSLQFPKKYKQSN